MNKKWECYETDEEKVNELIEKYHLSSLVAKILVNKNIVSKEKIELFLNPTWNDFHDPFLMSDMEKAVDRILKALKENERIIIYGDYDVDGITSITVLKNFLLERGAVVSEYIPNRLDEGYGLNKEAIEQIAKEKNTLMITVDCGITAKEEVEYALKLGI